MLFRQDDMTETQPSGTLYIVATPLGNLEDMTYRAVRILKDVDLIAAEDTRHSKKLLAHFQVDTPLTSCHEHNEQQKIIPLIRKLKQGKNIALISDAGTPCISDPGYALVQAVSSQEIPVIPVPGCSAATAGLSVSGLPTDTFYFMGFLPRKKQKLETVIHNVSNMNATLILYESPKRIVGLIEKLIALLGDRQACLAREITKLHEEYLRGNLSKILAELEKKTSVKGECALFIQGCGKKKRIEEKQLREILLSRMAEKPTGTSTLARQVAEEFGVSKKLAYDLILALKNT